MASAAIAKSLRRESLMLLRGLAVAKCETAIRDHLTFKLKHDVSLVGVTPSMNLRFRGWCITFEKIKITAFVGLSHVL